MNVVREYRASPNAKRWWIAVGEKRHGPFNSQGIAMDTAITMAKHDYRSGLEARVFVMEPQKGWVPLYHSDGPGV